MITVIGLGEVGIETFREMNRKNADVFGVDLKEDLLSSLLKEGFKVGKDIPHSEVYIICVYLTQQVEDVLKKIDYKNNPLVVIESTILPGAYDRIMLWKKENNFNFDIVLFPHRFNPNDPAHHVFNLDRVMGGEKKGIERALKFYEKFMPLELIHQTAPEIAELTKPMENAYRFMEISMAQEIKRLCDTHQIDFNELRRVMNTKWNIDVKEARDGIGGKCLPKDVALVNSFFKDNVLFRTGIELNENYKKDYSDKKIVQVNNPLSV